MPKRFVSIRMPHADPVFEAFTDRTYALLDAFATHVEKETGEPFEGHGFILLASDFLLLSQGERARWQDFDPLAFEALVFARMPALRAMRIPIALLHARFFAYLARTHVVTHEVGERVGRHARTLLARSAA